MFSLWVFVVTILQVCSTSTLANKIQTLSHHEERVWCVSWNHAGTILASCGEDKSICLWITEGLLLSRFIYNFCNNRLLLATFFIPFLRWRWFDIYVVFVPKVPLGNTLFPQLAIILGRFVTFPGLLVINIYHPPVLIQLLLYGVSR